MAAHVLPSLNSTSSIPAPSKSSTAVSFPAIIFCSALSLLLLLEQLSYLKKKRLLPGPGLVFPLLGSAVPMILNPTRYWRHLAHLALSSGHGFCADYLVGRFILFVRDTELSHKILSNVRPDAFMLIGHPFGKKLFGDHNLIYMFGQEHKDLRRRIAPNFTPRALATYLRLQQTIVLRHIACWVSLSSNGARPLPLRILCRDMNLETSQSVFVGPYLSDDSRKKFNHDYTLFNLGLMAMPFDLPGFAFRKARHAVSRLVDTLAGCASRSRARMASGEAEPTCLVDFWMQDTPPAEIGDAEVGGHLFDFLFAAQDASTSSLLWAMTLLESHPDVLRRVREEVASLWSPESGGPIEFEQLRGMKYTEMVGREVIRFRPPATLVPHIAEEEFPLTGYYTVPKGTIVFPSTYESSFQGFTEADVFDPDRFSEERQEDKVHKRNFLAFGAGPHQCVGQRYALNHLVLFMAMFVSLVDFKRHRTEGGGEDEIAYVPTIAPKDDCKLYLAKRCANFPQI